MKRRDAATVSALATMLPLAALGPAGAQVAHAPVPQVSHGRVERLAAFASRHVDARPVDVWLPPDYDARRQAGERFAVIYAHDGQMLFDATHTWNRKSWRLAEAARRLREAWPQAPGFLIVGPWNNGPLRHSEYFPAGFLPHLAPALRKRFTDEALRGQSRSDAYLRFLVEELKPAIDARYATRPGREACVLMGSSMGGLISAYGLCEHPQVFGAAGCLSTHWIGSFERNTAMPDAALAYLAQRLPPPAEVRLWTDRGTRELDALYDDAHDRVTALARARGHAAPRFVSRVVQDTGHSEDDWAARAHEVMGFVLGGPFGST